jgi:UTP--glucose-1-phosphate uridylyltransferase
VRKAVLTAAGLGTRLLPTTKELPKEMLPLFDSEDGRVVAKPLLQMLFEQLYDVGIRELYVVVGRGKRAIEDHFMKDQRFVEELSRRGGGREKLMDGFYSRLSNSRLVFLNQDEPRGFGDAVLRARGLISEDFLVAAGDTYIATDGHSHLRRLISEHSRRGNSATLLLRRVPDPSQYGVAVLEGDRVARVVEKPREFVGDLAIMPFYAFSPDVFEHLSGIGPGVGGEVQLTDAIQSMIDSGMRVGAVVLRRGVWMDIGSPEGYARALRDSYARAARRTHLTRRGRGWAWT